MRIGLLTLFCLTYFSAASAQKSDEPLVIYSERKPFLLEPLVKRYQAETGIKIQILTDQASVLLERLAAEGEYTQADIFMTVDAGSLVQAAKRGVLAPLNSPTLTALVPANLRDPQNRWFGLSLRARTMIYNPAKIDPALIQNYADLAKPALKGKLCLRSSKKVYNQSLIAMQLASLGEARTETMVRGWVANFAAPPFADDTLLINAVAAGQCAVAVVNTYYFGRVQKDNPSVTAKLLFADQKGLGTHVNISGAGVIAVSKQKAQAQAFLEWLAGAEAQALFAEANLEYPVNAKAKLDPVVAAWGSFKRDPRSIQIAGDRQAEAVIIMDRAGWR